MLLQNLSGESLQYLNSPTMDLGVATLLVL